MSGVRGVLTEALASEWVPSHTVYGSEEPVGFDSHYEWAAHVADVLLSLPGVAVVQLPQQVGINGNDNRVWSQRPNYVEQEFSGDVIINDRLGIDADELATLAADATNRRVGG